MVDKIMSVLDQPWFSQIRRPGRYLGNEINAIKKDLSKVEVSIALVFPGYLRNRDVPSRIKDPL